jgi:NitT/TauT family transport system substrate-binding protein
MFKIKKSFCKIIVAAFLTGIVLAACTPPKPAPQFKLRIGWFPVPDNLPYFVIVEQGFDKKNRLQFEEKQYEGGAAILEAMASGLPDGGYIGSVPVLLAAERRLIPDKIVPVAASSFADPDHPLIAVLVAPSVKGWKDLEGQLIAVNAINSLNTAAIKGRLRQEGIRDYKLVEIPFTNVGLALAGGNVAAATILEPFLTQSLLRGDGKLLDWIIGGPPFESFQIVLFVFSGDFYRNNPQAVKAFLRAHLQAVKWINQNPDGARSILTKRLGLSKEVGQKMKLPFWKLDAKNDPILLESMQPVLINVGMLKKPIPAKQLYDETLLEEVLKEQR